MKPLTHLEEFEAESPENQRLLRQEELILDVTEELAGAMETARVTKSELARRTGRSKSYVTQLLSGDRNLMLRTMADVAGGIGYKFQVTVRQMEPGDIGGDVLELLEKEEGCS